MDPGTGIHIPRDMRPRGSMSLVIWGRGGGKTMGGLYHYYTGLRANSFKWYNLKVKLVDKFFDIY